jgi:hypothetical protein
MASFRDDTRGSGLTSCSVDKPEQRSVSPHDVEEMRVARVAVRARPGLARSDAHHECSLESCCSARGAQEDGKAAARRWPAAEYNIGAGFPRRLCFPERVYVRPPRSVSIREIDGEAPPPVGVCLARRTVSGDRSEYLESAWVRAERDRVPWPRLDRRGMERVELLRTNC